MKGLFSIGVLCIQLIYTPIFAQSVTVASVSITVRDIEAESKFFTEVLSFKKVLDTIVTDEQTLNTYGLNKETKLQYVILSLGGESIKLLKFIGVTGRAYPADSRSNDLWFQHIAIVVKDMDKAYAGLLDHQVNHISTSPQTLPAYLPNAGGIKAFYFSDPEGHPLELIYFPPGKGHPKWQLGTTDRIFLGIDHTAIAVSNTYKSKSFYENLGLHQAGHSENYGTEQEHLNQVFGARLDINGFTSGKGIGVEFLRYISPGGGRPFPVDSKPWDLWFYQTEIQYSDDSTSFNQHLVKDPDGHSVLLIKSKSHH